MAEDLYAVLGVPHDADLETIKRAWRELARKLHPDRNPGDAVADAAFRRASAAWTILSDPDKRLVYDHFGIEAVREGFFEDLARSLRAQQPSPRQQRTPPPRPPPGRPPPAPEPRRPTPTRSGASRAEDVRVELTLSLREAARGGVRKVIVDEEAPCDACGGTGRRASGRFCSACRGSGRATMAREVEVKLPVSVATGQVLRRPGEARPGSDGRRGTLFVEIVVRPDPLFRRDGANLYVEVPLVEGSKTVDVPTLDGTLTIDMPVKPRDGQSLRVIGKGMPAPEGRAPGDLYAILRDRTR